ncbi:MAG: NlpC/P60 family protein [Eubacteriales bacterium]|nr:NlpC/P60 family protein [Eubacteriales bacterium]
MKNKYLTKYLCITLMSAMVLSGPMTVLAAEGQDAFVSEGIFDDQPDDSGFTSEPSATPEPEAPVTPEQPSPTPGETTPTPEEPTPTPGEDITPTPTPGEDITPTPTPPVEDLLPENVREIVDRLNELALVEITLEQEPQIVELRELYEKLTQEEKDMVSNYELLTTFEAKIVELKAAEKPDDPFSDDPQPVIDDGTLPSAISGTPIYYTNMASNLHAGKDFYLDSLKDNYQLVFADDFSDVMDEIEKEYKEKNKLSDASDLRTDGVTTSADTLLVRNWQDILAVYIYEQSKNGATSFTMDASCKDDLAKIFEEMNPVVRDKQNITKVSYGNRHINYYIKKNKVSKSDRKILKKYVETDCKLLCAVVTASKGFVRESVGDDVSEERVNVIAEAYSLVGKVGYFWGGKSNTLGEDPTWGSTAKVEAAGSNSTGTLRAYGLDCSGFVTWAVINGYQDQEMQASIGDGTSDQWSKANVVSEEEAQPGDLVFQRGPESGSDNHVGIICGRTDAGDWIAVHCSSSQNGVTVGEAYSAGFRYIRQPSFYPTDAEVEQMESQGAASSNAEPVVTDVSVGNTLQDIIGQNTFSSDDQTSSLLTSPELVDDNDIEVFVAP